MIVNFDLVCKEGERQWDKGDCKNYQECRLSVITKRNEWFNLTCEFYFNSTSILRDPCTSQEPENCKVNYTM